MSSFLVDTSVWVAYFRGEANTKILGDYINANLICVNNLILAELIPLITIKNEDELADMLQSVARLPLKIDWQQIIEFQVTNLRNGINKVGVPDLIIYQNAIDNDVFLLTLDKHFQLMSKHIECKVKLIN